MNQVGCEKCWSADADAAWNAVDHAAMDARLIDELHFIVSIRVCPACKQQFLQITTETVDWEGGEDPVYRTVIPIEPDERVELEACNPLTESVLEGIGRGRRSLKYAWPAGQDPSVYWGTGVRIGPHD